MTQINVTAQELPVIGVNAPDQPTLNVIGLPGEQGPQGPPGESGTIVHVGPTPPENPALNALWVDTS